MPAQSLICLCTAAPVHIGVIGGTGLSELPGFSKAAELTIDTPWGPPSSPITILHHKNATTGAIIAVAFLSRHGRHHTLAPHEIPARANIAALRRIGVRAVVAFSAVGSLQAEIRPRDFVVPDQVIDRTKGVRPWTFFEKGVVVHVPFADPFDGRLAGVVRRCGRSLEGEDVTLHEGGTLICMGMSLSISGSRHASNDEQNINTLTEGPQFSTRAESNLYRSWGGAVVNMSCLPESKLAREAELAYVMVCMATDYDCWHTGDSGAAVADVSVDMVMATMRDNANNARRFVAGVLDRLGDDDQKVLVTAQHLEGATKMGLTTHQSHIPEQAKERLNWLFPGYFQS